MCCSCIAGVASFVFVRNENNLADSKKNLLADYVCKLIEPRLQVGAFRDVEDFINVAAYNIEPNLIPLIILTVDGKPKSIGPDITGSQLIHSCSFSGISDVHVDFHFRLAENSWWEIAEIYCAFFGIAAVLLSIVVAVTFQVQITFSDVVRSLIRAEFEIESNVDKSTTVIRKILGVLRIDVEILKDLSQQFKLLKATVERQNLELLEKSKSDLLVEMATQVSHDIRSPLAALNVVIKNLPDVPDVQRNILQNAVGRINDISNTLLAKSKDASKNSANSDAENLEFKSTCQLAVLVEGVLDEKRVQYSELDNIQIVTNLKGTYGVFVCVPPTEITRIISNLVNNSVEGLPNETGLVTISIGKIGLNAILTIEDNGVGIPTSILRQLGARGVSHGKTGSSSGSGLGIYHAKKVINRLNGNLAIDSRAGAGTTVTISIPLVPAPAWFVRDLVIEKDSIIVSIDSESSIHSRWRAHISSQVAEGLVGAKFSIVCSKTELQNWYEGNSEDLGRAVFLIAYEFLDQFEIHFNLVTRPDIAAKCIVVTNLAEDVSIQHRCEQLGVKLLAKNILELVPITLNL